MNSVFWKGKRVLVTGHTGFKGSWICLWLQRLGAEVVGYALSPPTNPNLFDLANVGCQMRSVIGDITDKCQFDAVVKEYNPEIIIHMAAQSLVRESYVNPTDTYATNVMGTVNVLEAVRLYNSVRVVIIVTTDKCYENNEWIWGYRENDRLGGADPYSNSKACAELVTSAYQKSFFNGNGSKGPAVATVRAGNVIGGGDWAQDRLIPDIIRAFQAGEMVKIRNPNSIRPWQQVIEPLAGYLLLAQKLWGSDGRYSEGWNFGPNDEDARPVEWIVQNLAGLYGRDASWECKNSCEPHEASFLKLDCSKVRERLGWKPRLSLSVALQWTLEWYEAHHSGKDMREFTLKQITDYENMEIK